MPESGSPTASWLRCDCGALCAATRSLHTARTEHGFSYEFRICVVHPLPACYEWEAGTIDLLALEEVTDA